MNGPGPFGGTPNIASVNKVPMIGGGGMPSSQQNQERGSLGLNLAAVKETG